MIKLIAHSCFYGEQSWSALFMPFVYHLLSKSADRWRFIRHHLLFFCFYHNFEMHICCTLSVFLPLTLCLLFLLLTSHFLPTGWSWCIHVVITPADMWRGSMLQTRRLLNCDQLFACCLTSFLTWRRKKTKNMHKYRCRCTYVNVHIRQIKTRSDVHPPLCVFTTSAVQIFD